MTAEPDLLPLPSVLLNWPHPTNHAAIRDYARACVAHATAAKDAEIEALRAEVERLQSDTSFATAISSLRREKVRAERLAEALRKIAALTEEFDDLDDAVGIANEALERENDDA